MLHNFPALLSTVLNIVRGNSSIMNASSYLLLITFLGIPILKFILINH